MRAIPPPEYLDPPQNGSEIKRYVPGIFIGVAVVGALITWAVARIIIKSGN